MSRKVEKTYYAIRNFLPKDWKDHIFLHTGKPLRWSSADIQPIGHLDGVQFLLLKPFEVMEAIPPDMEIETPYGRILIEDDPKRFIFMPEDFSRPKRIYLGMLWDMLFYYFLHGIENFYSYKELSEHSDSDVACVGYIPDEEAWVGFTHRAFMKFRMWDTVEVGKDSLLLESGYNENASKDLRKREVERIEKIKSWIKDGKIIIDSEEKAKLLAFRVAEATG